MSDSYPRMVPAKNVRVGDLVDLEGDSIADPDRQNFAFECELQAVSAVEEETRDCIAIHFEGVDTFGFPPDHKLKVALHDEAYDR